MSDRGFDSIAQAMLKQKQLMDELENENRELRRQLTELRAGYGVFIEVEGKRFPIKGEVVVMQASPVLYTMQQDSAPLPTPVAASEEPVSPIDEMEEIAPALELASVEEAPVQPQQEEEPEKVPTFLEEIMLDEFAAASTSPMSVWKGANKKQEQEQAQIDEEQKAALRRELMGSFLLE